MGQEELPPIAESPESIPEVPQVIDELSRLRLEAHAVARTLDNGLSARSVELGCRMESACENSTDFHLGVQF
jgi:hypothetical protein